MPWRCPACRLPIHHSEVEARPRPQVLYRCHICRLELVLDPDVDRLTIAPMPSDDSGEKIRATE